MRRLACFASLCLLLCSAPGCECDGRDGPRDGQIPDIDAGELEDGAMPPRRDAGNFDPFDPENGCGSAAIPTERVPGQLLLIFDRSGSMRSAPDGEDATASNPSKWDVSRMAINSVLASVSDELSMGLLLFPTGEGEECDVVPSAGVPHVPMGPLATTRPMIMSELSSASPSGGVTPMFDAVQAGYDYLDTLSGPGQRGLVLVTDGAENCDDGDRDMVMQRAADELATSNYLTYAVGLTTSNNDLSTLAYNGGTPRNDTCLPECTSELCMSSADCMGGAPCNQPIAGFPGFCGCNSDADCIAPQTCMQDPFMLFPAQCSGDPNCCHYDASAGNFQMEFEAALEDIASRFLDSCVFDLPRGTDPSMFDPSQVNVGVTFDGEMRRVLGRSMDSSMDSWDFTSSDQTSIIIQGPICDRLLMESATVEIVLGCPTILI